MIDHKLGLIRSQFAAIVKSKIIRYETAELLNDDNTWISWPDLPIRLYTDTKKLISISWSRFDDLWITGDLSLPFALEDSTVRWVENSIDKIYPVIGETIQAVMLGQGEMSWDGVDVDIWTRLLIELDNGWLEIFNAFDENGYDFHDRMPAGNVVPCI